MPDEFLIFQTPRGLQTTVELDFTELFHLLRLIDYAPEVCPEGDDITQRLRRRLASAWCEVTQPARIRELHQRLYPGPEERPLC